jgi:hypothetical protein
MAQLCDIAPQVQACRGGGAPRSSPGAAAFLIDANGAVPLRLGVNYEAEYLLGGITMRPIRPEPAECPKIKKAMRAARFMKWGATPLFGLALLAAIFIGVASEWYWGVIVFVVTGAPLLIFGYSAARCPRCGQVWWPYRQLYTSLWSLFDSPVVEDETESMVCRRCHLDIGLGLREK